ncbi:MAG: ABC transporter ATP-binding protein [Anaerolinea sp.]|nr:ABC transporter ATP-binding protein [Anaerolinea sp.]
MSDIAIKVENLGKRYRIGAQQERYKTLRESLMGAVIGPLRHLRNLQSAIRNPQSNFIWALKNISFEVKQGDVVGIIGRNGAGKSTLLKVLSHITEPTEGRVALRGRVGSLLEVGTGFHPELTGRENIYLNGAILGMRRSEIERRFDEIVAFAEIERFLDTPVKRYSSGMYVRLAFAVAAHLEPEILLVDEVLAVGDAEFQNKCLGKMGDVAKQGRVVLFVSHNLQAITSLCWKGILLLEGQMLYDGSAREAVSRYVLKSSDDQVLEQEIENKPRRSGEGKTVRLTRISLSFPNNSAQIWEPLKFDLRYKCLMPNYTFSLSVEVWRMDGSCAFTTDSEDDCMVLNMGSGMDGMASVLVPNPNLAPDRYVVRAVARSGGRVIDWIDEALTFDVLGKDRTSIRVSERHLGNRARGHWEILKL